MTQRDTPEIKRPSQEARRSGETFLKLMTSCFPKEDFSWPSNLLS
jgi:hypothetical protein